MKNKIMPLMVASAILAGGNVYGKDEEIGVEISNRDWVHYNTNIVEGKFSSITPVGYIAVTYGKESGKSKIFPELNIFGIGQVSKNPNLDYKADFYGINYGLKSKLGDYKATLGVGFKSYHGDSNCISKGCKDIKSQGYGFSGKLENIATGDNYNLDYKRKEFIPTQYHIVSAIPVPLRQKTITVDDYLDFTANFENFGTLEYNRHFGSKNDVYSLLIPRNDISFNENSITILPKFKLNTNTTLHLGPILCAGSVEGSIAKADINSCYGGKAILDMGTSKVSLSAQRKSSEGNKSFNEFKINESVDVDTISLGLEINNLDINGYYSKKKQVGDILISNPTFGFIAGGSKFRNFENTNEYGLNIGYIYDQKTKFYLDLNGIEVKGKLYNNPNLNETGLKATVGIERNF